MHIIWSIEKTQPDLAIGGNQPLVLTGSNMKAFPQPRTPQKQPNMSSSTPLHLMFW